MKNKSMVGRWLAGVFLGCASIAGAGINSWTQTGPEGGPIHAVATHPTNPDIAVISTNRGLARSTNCLTDCTWTIVKNDTLNAPLDIAFDPSSPNRVVASDGLLYLSEDTGQTFQIAQGPEALGNVYRIAFGPDGTLYATTHAGNAYKATPPLAHWVSLTTAWPANSRIESLVVDPTNSQIVYAGVESAGVYRSNNGGSSWAGPLTTGFTASATFIIYQLAVDPAHPTHVFAATSTGIYRSVNSGSNWTLVDGSPASSIDLKPGASDQMIAIIAGGSVLESFDNGASWERMGIELQSAGLPRVRYAAGPVTRLLYASFTGMSISGDLPHTHSNRNMGIGGAAPVTRIVKANDDIIYAALDADWGSVYRRVNTNYQYAGSYTAYLQAITGARQISGLAVSATNSNVIFVINRGYELLHSTDGAQTWTGPYPFFASGSASDSLLDVKISPSNPQVAYVARTETGVWKTINGGFTFTQLTNSPAYVAAIGINPLNPNVLYAAGGPTNGSGIYKSVDGGANWAVQFPPSPMSNLSYSDFAFHPVEENTVYALGFGGVQKTVNGGGAWSLVNFGPPAGTVIAASALIFDPLIPTTMIVLNNGSAPGFSRSVDGGATWLETGFDIPGREGILYSGILRYGTLSAGTNSVGLVDYTVAPDLSISMANIPDVLPLGTTYQNPITVTNHGPHASSAAEISIFKPAWLTPGALPNCTSTSPREMTCRIGVLQSGESVVVPLSFAVAGTVDGSQVLVLLNAHEPDPDTTNNRIDDDVTAADLVDLDMTLTAEPAVIDLAGTTEVTAQFINQGPSPAANARIEIFLPGITLESSTPSAGTCSHGGAYVCNFGTVPPGGTATVVLRFRGNLTGTFPVTASVYAASPDSDNAFNTAQLDIVVRPVSDIAVSLAESADPVNVDAPLQYIATLRSNGPDEGITELDVAVTGATVAGATSVGGTCTNTSSAVKCSVHVAPGAGASTVTISLATATPGIATATAIATFEGVDPQPDNNTAIIGSTIRREGDVGVGINISDSSVTLGAAFSYSVSVRNDGPNAGPVAVSIPVTGASVASASSTIGTCTNTANVATCNMTSLSRGLSAIITVNLTAAEPGWVTATPTATFQGFDPDATNNSTSAEILIRRVGDIGVEIVDSVDPATAGVPYTYTATVRNSGPNAGAVQLAVPVTGAAVTAAVATSGGICTTAATAALCDFAMLASGASATVTVTVDAASTGTARATATATFAGTDLAAANNSATAETLIRRVGDIGVVLADSVDPATSGVPFTYTATLSNSGPNAGAVQVAIPVTGAAVTAATSTGGGTCTTTAAAAQCDFAQIASGATATVTVTVNATAAGTASATATATFAGTDPAAGNNAATASTTVVAPPPPPPPSGGSSSSSSSSSSGGGGGGGGGSFDWLALGLLAGALARRIISRRT